MKYLLKVYFVIILLIFEACYNINEVQEKKVNDSIAVKDDILAKIGTVKIKAGNGSLFDVGYLINDSVYNYLSKEDLEYIANNLELEAYGSAKYPLTMRPDTSIKVNIMITPYENGNIRASFVWLANNAFNVPDMAFSDIILKNDMNKNTRDSIIRKSSF